MSTANKGRNNSPENIFFENLFFPREQRLSSVTLSLSFSNFLSEFVLKEGTVFTRSQIHYRVSCNCTGDWCPKEEASCPGNAFARKGNSVHGPVNVRVSSPRGCGAAYVKCDRRTRHTLPGQSTVDRKSCSFSATVSRPVASTIPRRCLRYFCSWLPRSNVRDAVRLVTT